MRVVGPAVMDTGVSETKTIRTGGPYLSWNKVNLMVASEGYVLAAEARLTATLSSTTSRMSSSNVVGGALPDAAFGHAGARAAPGAAVGQQPRGSVSSRLPPSCSR
jgi:hypothetical protein